MWGRIKRWRWLLLIAGLLAAGLLYALWPEAIPVDTARVTSGEMSVGITDDGVTRAKDVYVVSAPVTGYLERIELEPGDRVESGALLARMTARPSSPLDQRSRDELRGALASAAAAEAGAAAALGQSRRDLARSEELASRGFLPRAQLEAARTRVATDNSAREQARAEMARLRAMLADPSGSASGTSVTVRAPASGEILSLINESEAVIAEGTPLITIGDPAAIELVVDLRSREAVQVEEGDRVTISQWGGTGDLAGYVARIEPFGRLNISALGIEEQRVNVIVELDPSSRAQAARLGHGFQIDATIELWRGEEALRLPIGALFRGPSGEWQVFIIESSRARIRTIELGHLNDEHAEVLSGLEQNAVVIVNPSGEVTDGVRVKVRE
ncbi:efflux RND transporter periplasmic adaptor subunit [Aurantiacibacter marinus]|uniref:RND transporter n=1 Tax=Aurantiacibacter marinus TaxID=874156 RepID=A0A0H0XKR7_9SPHN|nr:efflux RND transporter periplasmic adaptor subunit [Aurantiacibacter marinus]KLI62924.1 RND transporter [Aurantiacibacter marinus]